MINKDKLSFGGAGGGGVGRLSKRDKLLIINLNNNGGAGTSPPHKDTRWDRIRKKYTTNTSAALKSDVVKKIIEKDFIGKHKEKILNGELEEVNRFYDPILIMDMRHEMFQKIPRKLPVATVAREQRQQMNSCVAHNIAVEERYIENELKKFRNQLEKNFKRNQLNIKVKKDNTKMDNEPLMKSLENTSKLIEDFYSAPIEAINEASEATCLDLIKINSTFPKQDNESSQTLNQTITSNQESLANEDLTIRENIENGELLPDLTHSLEKNLIDSNIPLNPEPINLEEIPTDDLFNDLEATTNAIANRGLQKARAYSSDETAEAHSLNARTVRFETSIEVRKYDRESSSCSNTSEGIDSVVSDIAEEALLELQNEADEKVKNEQQNSNELHQSPKPIEQVKEPHLKDSDILLIKRFPLEPNPNAKSEPLEKCSSSSTEHREDEESISNHEQDRIINQLFQARSNTTKEVLRHYFLKWIHYTTLEKIERENCQSKNDRVKRINAFLDKLRREKTRQNKYKPADNNSSNDQEDSQKPLNGANKMQAIVIAKKYKNKIKVQQDIIDMQRLKLERQERLIMELKLHKLSEEAKETRQDIKNELKALISCGEPKAKAKAKCLQIIGDLKEKDEDEFSRLRGKALMMPKFLQNMHERALERSIKHEQARQRRLQQEAEKEAQKIAAEEAKRLEDEEAKKLRMEILKERRRQEKMAKVLKERERVRALENQKKAQEFCRRLLLRRVGMEGFKRLLQRKNENIRKSESFRRQLYKRSCFSAWRAFVILQVERNLSLAESLHEKIVKRNAVMAWKEYIFDLQCKYNVAVDWWELKFSERLFTHWWAYTKRMSMIQDTKMQQASAHHEWHLKWKVLTCWQRLPQILQIEKETEERRQRWRLKIWELLPDYSPNRDDLA